MHTISPIRKTNYINAFLENNTNNYLGKYKVRSHDFHPICNTIEAL